MKRLLAAALIAFSGVAAAETYGVHVASHHFPDRTYSNFNPGVYVITEAGLTAGVYRNSFGRVGAYAGYTFSVGPLDITAGLVHGYRHPWLVFPSLKLGDHVRIGFLPPAEKEGSAVVHLMLERSF